MSEYSPEVIQGHLYDYPTYYDLVFGSDWRAEMDFLNQCFQKHVQGKVQRIFEPACGTGRLLVRFAAAGYEAAGNDLNPHAVKYCNARLRKKNLPESIVVGDMSNFKLKRKADVMFNMINSFRHLPDEISAENHLRCVAGALRKGGIYVLGLHLTPTRGQRCTEEAWSAQRGHLSVLSRLWTIELNRAQRFEHVGMTFDVYTPTRQFQIADECTFRTYTHAQMQELISKVSEFELIETYDFCYEIDQPIKIKASTEDVVFVLRKK